MASTAFGMCIDDFYSQKIIRVASNVSKGYRQELSWPNLTLSQNLRGRSKVNHGTYQTLRAIPPPPQAKIFVTELLTAVMIVTLKMVAVQRKRRVGKASLSSHGHLL